ncbi:MAG: hypothetical protein JXA22_01335 [Candidatus Thermoplasmatota archaeon]|nr:hypothetical protein [Candidatus Thermoplasmatota archaeon]
MKLTSWLSPILIGLSLVLLSGMIFLTVLPDSEIRLKDEGNLDPDTGDGALDTDGDGISDLDEVYIWGTDITLPDTDGDGLPDRWEIVRGLDPRDNGTGTGPVPGSTQGQDDNDTRPFPDKDMGMNGDPDGDGLTNFEEYCALQVLGSYLDPRNPDTDGDGMWDGWEMHYGIPINDTGKWTINASNPSDSDLDPDLDGLTNFKEFIIGTDPNLLDSDGDGLSDSREAVLLGLDPNSPDTDNDGLPDNWEVMFSLNATDPSDANIDSDGDGLLNYEEYELKDLLGNWTNPSGADRDHNGIPDGFDSDLDGMPDGWEVENGLHPLNGKDGGLDPDQDGLDLDENGILEGAELFTNREEYDVARIFGRSTDPNEADTDGDGLMDGVEIEGWEIIINSVRERTISNPHLNDTDHDGLKDKVEREVSATNASMGDSDGDGLTDFQEYHYRFTYDNHSYKTDPTMRDTDGDLLSDMEEVYHGLDGFITNASNPDTDRDGLTDGEETLFPPRPFQEQCDPNKEDTDGDGMGDGWEMGSGEKGSPSISLLFSDHIWVHESENRSSGFWKWRSSGTWEFLGDAPGLTTNLTFGWLIDPTVKWDADLDPDGDGLTNLLESDDGWNIDPFSKDTDRDGLPDGWEVKYTQWNTEMDGWELDPSNPDSDGDGREDGDEDLDSDGFDSDHDGSMSEYEAFTNMEEYLNGTDPNDPDSDNDGMPDGYEVYFRDSDEDGMPDGWERKWCFDPYDDRDAALDADDDGFDNRSEYLAGTDPRNGGSRSGSGGGGGT